MADDKIEIQIVLDDGQVRTGFARIAKESKKSGKKIGKNLGASLGGLKTQLLALGSIFALVFAGRKVIDAAIKQEDAIDRLNTALRNAGQFSTEISEDIQQFASDLQSVTAVSDDSILSMIGLAQSFVTTAEEAKELTAAALDFSVGAGISFEESIRRLGRGVQGASGDIANFAPEIRNLTREQLKAGDATRILAERFKDTALVKTFSGRIQQLSNLFDDLLANIGLIVTKSPALVAVFGEISSKIAAVTKSITEFGKSGDVFGDLLLETIIFAKSINTLVIAPLELVFNIVKIAIAGTKLAIQGLILSLAKGALGVVEIFSPKGKTATALRAFTENAAGVFEDFSREARESTEGIFDFDITASVDNLLVDLERAARESKEILKKIKSNFKDTADGTKKELTATAKAINAAFQQGITKILVSSIARIGAALVNGKDAFKDFGSAVLGQLGDLAIQMGTLFLGIGLGLTRLSLAIATLNGPEAVAAGIALIVLGGALKALSGGTGAAATAQAGGGAGGPDVTPVTEVGGLEIGDTARVPTTEVVVNITGVVTDPRGVAQQISELLTDFQDSNGGQVIARTA